jgi:peptidoglycan/LPS O-acetylase OafA/YrhL
MLLAAPILRAVFPGTWAVLGTPWRADSLMTGVLLAWFIRNPELLRTARENRFAIHVTFGILLVGALATNYFTARFPFNLTFTHFWLAMLFGLLLLIVIIDREGLIARALNSRVLVWLGTISYGVYLFHQAITWMLHGAIRYLPPSIATLEGLAVTVLSLATTLTLATLSFRFLERPVIAYGHRYRYF